MSRGPVQAGSAGVQPVAALGRAPAVRVCLQHCDHSDSAAVSGHDKAYQAVRAGRRPGSADRHHGQEQPGQQSRYLLRSWESCAVNLAVAATPALKVPDNAINTVPADGTSTTRGTAAVPRRVTGATRGDARTLANREYVENCGCSITKIRSWIQARIRQQQAKRARHRKLSPARPPASDATATTPMRGARRTLESGPTSRTNSARPASAADGTLGRRRVRAPSSSAPRTGCSWHQG